MTNGSAASHLQDNFLLGLGASFVAVVVAGYLCNWAEFSQATTTSVMTLAFAVPAAVEVQIQRRRRDINVDIARIRRGELRRPVVLVVMVLAVAIVLLDTVLGATTASLKHLAGAGYSDTAEVWHGLTLLPLASFGMCLFLVASYASQYFATRPYLWTAAAVGCALAVQELMMLMLKSDIRKIGGSPAGVLVAEVLIYLGFLFICMVGVWLGRRYHDEFLARKLARMEGKAAREAANQDQSTLQSQTTATQASVQDSNAPQNSKPKLVTVLSRPNDVLAAPDNHRASDPFKQIEKLAHLRDTGALTEEEFQAKKTEILCRI